MILWTIQDEQVYLNMLKTGTIRADLRFVDEFFIKSYSWMMKQMTARIGKAPDGVASPVWAWYQWEGKRKRPDMRTHGRRYNPIGNPIVLITADVPDEKVLLSDFDYWHFVLGNWALDLSDSDEDIQYSQEDKEKSWEQIFDIDCSFDGEAEHPYLSTQATMWEIKQEWVKKVEHFKSR